MSKFKQTVKKAVSKVEHSLGLGLKILIGLGLVSSLSVLAYLAYPEEISVTSPTTMITNMRGNSGGSGSVIFSSDSMSFVLTNSHVCGICKNGAVVKTSNGLSHVVDSYQQSEIHDLCLIKVLAKLPGKVSIAENAAELFEHAVISGHPALLPNVVTEGSFSGNLIIDVFIGTQPCSKEQLEDPNTGDICQFFKGIPTTRTYESTLVTATIMPGSSGSAVYNSKKELSNVVFAGSGDLGYAFTVPHGYIINFLEKEVHHLPVKVPNYRVAETPQLPSNSDYKNIEVSCKTKVNEITDVNVKAKIENICKAILKDVLWRD